MLSFRSVGECDKLLCLIEEAALGLTGRIAHPPTRILVWVDDTADHHTGMGPVSTFLPGTRSQSLCGGLGSYSWADFVSYSCYFLVALRYHSQLSIPLQFLGKNLVFVSIPVTESPVYVVDPSRALNKTAFFLGYRHLIFNAAKYGASSNTISPQTIVIPTELAQLLLMILQHFEVHI